MNESTRIYFNWKSHLNPTEVTVMENFLKRNNDCTPFPKGVFATEQSGVNLWLVYFGKNNCVEADERDIFVAPEMVLSPLPKVKSAKCPTS